MKKMMKCPVCNTENERTYYTDSGKLVENYYSCNHCGYGFDMCCSPVREFIDLSYSEVNWFSDIKEAWNKRENNGWNG